MEKKILSSIVFALLALILVSSAASAALELTSVTIPTQVNHKSNVTITFSLTNTGTVNQTALDWSDTAISKGTIQLPALTTINAGETRQLTAMIGVPEFSSGTIALNLGVDSAEGESDSLQHTFTINNAPQITFTKTQDLGINTTGIVQIRNTGNAALDLTLSETSSFGAILSETSMSLAPGAMRTLTVDIPDNTDLEFGSNLVTIQAVDSSQSLTQQFSFSLPGNFCSNGPKGGHLEITTVDLSNNGEGDDNEWKLLDEVELEVEVENQGDEEIEDVIVEIALIDSEGNNQVGDLDFESVDEEEMELGDLDDGDEEMVTFRFRVPADLEDGSYKLAVKAYSDDLGESNECVDVASDLSDGSFEDIDIQREDDEGKFIAFEDIIVTPTEAVCGDRVTVSADVFNIGDEDQDQVKVTLESRELSLDRFVEIRSDLDQGDSEEVTFEFEVPQGVANKNYDLFLGAQYDYNNGNYRESLDEDTRILLRVLGCTGTGTPTNNTRIASINAELDSEAIAGEQLIVRATITNLKSERSTLVLGANGYQSWADLADISERILDLNPGQSAEVSFTFDVNEDAVDDQTFTIEVVSGAQTERREVVVTLEEASPEPGVGFNLGNNAYLWIIGIVNVILIILIIVVAVRISRR